MLMPVSQLIFHAADIWGVPAALIRGDHRDVRSTRPRHAVMYVAVKELSLSSVRVSRALGGRDHTTILHGCRRVVELVERDPQYRDRVQRLVARSATLPAGDFLSTSPDVMRARKQLRRLADDAVDQLIDLASEEPEAFRDLLALAMRGELKQVLKKHGVHTG